MRQRRRTSRASWTMAAAVSLGAAGTRRVTTYYQRGDMLARYRALYESLIVAPAAQPAERT